MAKHRAVSDRRRRALTLAGGVLAGAALSITAPAALAYADEGTEAPSRPTSDKGNSLGRPALDNPAPGVRLAQNLGDTVFHPGGGTTGGVQNSLNNSQLGQAYHRAFGTRGQVGEDGKYDANATLVDDEGNLIDIGCGAGVNGCNGSVTGVLNSPKLPQPGQVYAQTVNIRECQIVTSTDGVPRGLQSKQKAVGKGQC